VKTRRSDTIEGALKNQDNFSVQVMSLEGELIPIARSDIASWRLESRSLMPSDAARKLAPEELQNLLAFLDRQRAPFLHHEIGFQTY
jgi:hypothetical protein